MAHDRRDQGAWSAADAAPRDTDPLAPPMPEVQLPEFLRRALAEQEGLAPGPRFNARVLTQVREASWGARWSARLRLFWHSAVVPNQLTSRLTVGLAGILVLLVLGLALSLLGAGRAPADLKAQFPRAIPGGGLGTPLPLNPPPGE